MGEEKAGETQTAEETLAGGEPAASNEDSANSNSLDFTGDSTATDQAQPLRLETNMIPDHKKIMLGERLPTC